MNPHNFGNLDPHPDLHPHQQKIRILMRIHIKYKNHLNQDPYPHPDPNQCDKLDPEPHPDPNQFTDKPKFMEYEPI
jgi:hypothetical protein